MYFKKGTAQTLKTALMPLVLLFLGCSKEQPINTKLDSGVETQYALILEGKSGSARVRLRQYMEKHGVSPDAMFLMGLSYHKEKQYAKAVDWFAQSTASSGRLYPPSLHYLGWSYYYLGDTKKASLAFTTFLEYQPQEGDSLFALGLLATEEGNAVGAKELFQRALDSPNSTDHIRAKTKARLADVYVELDDRDGAILLYQESVQLNPDLYEAWYRLSQVLKRAGNETASYEAYLQSELARKRVRPELFSTRFPE